MSAVTRPDVAGLVASLSERGLSLAIAESLTGGLVIAEFAAIAGVSDVLNGGVVAYNTEIKHTLLGVDRQLLAEHGPVHPQVAAHMATGVRTAMAIAGVPARVGLATTGVAGPGAHDGCAAGTVYLAVAIDDEVTVMLRQLVGSRSEVRAQSVVEILVLLRSQLDFTEGRT